ncbi:hypothetical protein [Nocardioides lijunqiniae]|uniref:hypothetical protein n=1 Tax=Nocardioides lijunqiniae TaxID=2760832 RepID=UPI001877AF3F|nr:hypothetical protein [Nocardioides lijunqiniae]
MTDRLSTLMHRAAEGLDVPPPSTGVILTRGRALRRRRRLASAGAAAAVLVLVAGGAAVLDPDQPSEPTPSRGVDEPPRTLDLGATLAVGSTLVFRDGTEQAELGDRGVTSLHYTSVGVLVRHGDRSSAEPGGTFSLVHPDATVSPVDISTGAAAPVTDPAEPYVAYVQRRGGATQVVIHDLGTGAEVARADVPSSEDLRPVALSGDVVYLNAGDDDYVVDWRAGTVSEPGIVHGRPDVAGGRLAAVVEGRGVVLDARNGEQLFSVAVARGGRVDLSPDGRFVALDEDDGVNGFEVYDVDSGSRVQFPGVISQYGWSPDGDIFRVRGNRMTVCVSASGVCDVPDVRLPPGRIRLGGWSYEQ